VQRRAAELVAEHEARECAEVLEKVAAAGAHGLAVTGLERVVEALRKGQVETLVLADDPDDATTLLVGNSPLELGVNQHDMDALGTHGTVVPADGALLAAAVAGSADVVVVPLSAASEHPVAAVLRYADASTDA
jgi:peptide subunit release factor 1 (eRF1)